MPTKTLLRDAAALRAVVVATGTSAAVPPIPGLAQARPWTSRQAASSPSAPTRLAIIGGGVVGTEMATAYNALGAAVTLIARDGVLPSVEPYAAEHVVAALRAAGVDVRLARNRRACTATRTAPCTPRCPTAPSWTPTRSSSPPAARPTPATSASTASACAPQAG
jgi:pyruvate/2-oxoglutarate dehydrogenase complex dihydrolipoamide dehydrogenase (E3) component